VRYLSRSLFQLNNNNADVMILYVDCNLVDTVLNDGTISHKKYTLSTLKGLSHDVFCTSIKLIMRQWIGKMFRCLVAVIRYKISAASLNYFSRNFSILILYKGL